MQKNDKNIKIRNIELIKNGGLMWSAWSATPQERNLYVKLHTG